MLKSTELWQNSLSFLLKDLLPATQYLENAENDLMVKDTVEFAIKLQKIFYVL